MAGRGFLKLDCKRELENVGYWGVVFKFIQGKKNGFYIEVLKWMFW
jgi:hypothetical protein